jgi:hypothetical protein
MAGGAIVGVSSGTGGRLRRRVFMAIVLSLLLEAHHNRRLWGTGDATAGRGGQDPSGEINAMAKAPAA